MRRWLVIIGALLSSVPACFSVTLPPDPAPGVDAGAVVAEGSAPEGHDAGSRSTYTEEVLADQPLGYWRLNEAADAAGAKDFVKGFYPGTYLNQGQPVTFGIDGAVVGDPDTAISLGQASISMGNVGAFNFPNTSAFSLEAWVKPTGAQGTVLSKLQRYNEYSWDTGYSLALIPSEGLVFARHYFIDYKVSVDKAMRPSGLRPNVWSHVVATYDGAKMELFIDGEQAAPPVAAVTLLSGTSAPWGVGKASNAVNQWVWAGGIDEVAVYDHALTPTRIARHYTVGAGK